MHARELDYDALKQYAVDQIGGLLFVTISGAHLYGFPSPDSDVDLRGTFAAPLEQILSLDKPKETREPKGEIGSLEVELVGHELEKYLRLLVKPNGYVLEQIFSPLVVLTSPAHAALKELAQASISRRLYHHYSGFARSEWRDYQKIGVKTVKRLLYLHRVLMTGIVLLREGVVESNLHALSSRFHFDLEPLVEMKTRELAEVNGDEAAFLKNVEFLFSELETAYAQSSLPDDVPNRDALSTFLVQQRLNNFTDLMVKG